LARLLAGCGDQVGGSIALGKGVGNGLLDRFGGGGLAERPLAMSLPAMSGAEPWIGSYRPWMP
jgi:hypothetical protein